MSFPLRLGAALARQIALHELQGRRRYPLRLMLEPLFHCNLACAGCVRQHEAQEIGFRMLGARECLSAAQQAAAPVVSLGGGEPLLHPEIGELVSGLLAQHRFVELSTNGVLLEGELRHFAPSPYLSFVVRLDGLAPTHDRLVGRQGAFEQALASIRAAKRAGFQVRTCTTISRGADPEEAGSLLQLLAGLGVDGVSIAAGAGRSGGEEAEPPTRAQLSALLRQLSRGPRPLPFRDSPVYRQFLAGDRALQCSPWASPTCNPKGWKSPCNLVADGYKESFESLMNETPWERYGVGRDARCSSCRSHAGFEASALREVGGSLTDLWNMAWWVLGR
jgi:hopanoid biosynthesis associated radical SAM protein HpnH